LEGIAMTTEAQVTANRLNALKSTGPRTPQGKAVVAQNAVKHGLLARQNVIAGEDPQEFEVWRRGWLGELDPVGHAETTLAERVAGLSWRLRRAECIQNQIFDFLLAKDIDESMRDLPGELSAEDERRLRSNPNTDPDLAVGRMVRKDYSHEKAIERLMMYERWIENSLYRTMRELRQVKRARKVEGGDGEAVPKASLVARASCPCTHPIERTGKIPAGRKAETASPRAGETPATQPPADRQGITDCAEQSQSRVADTEETQDLESLQIDDATRCGRDGMADCAKQSQIPKPAAALQAIAGPRPRVMWHTHDVGRS
jgi:hypothetical protein